MARCSYCHGDGHNVRTCPTKTEYLKSCAENSIKNGNPDAWIVREYQKRIRPAGKKAADQRCSYCGELGHTRRRCPVMQKDIEFYTSHHNFVVRALHDYIVSSPIGIGSFARWDFRTWTNTGWEAVKRNYILTGFKIGDELLTPAPDAFAVFTDPASGDTKWARMETMLEARVGETFRNSYEENVTILSAEQGILPPDWVSSRTVDFDSAKKRNAFVRTGRKHEDERSWTFVHLEEWRQAADMPEGLRESYRQRCIKSLNNWEPTEIRKNIMSRIKYA